MKRFAFLLLLMSLSISVLAGCEEDGDTFVVNQDNQIANMSFHVTGTFDKNSCPQLIKNALTGKVDGIESVNVTNSGDVLVVLAGRVKGEEQQVTSEISNQLKNIKHVLETVKFTYVSP